jgi:hypothetical protein
VPGDRQFFPTKAVTSPTTPPISIFTHDDAITGNIQTTVKQPGDSTKRANPYRRQGMIRVHTPPGSYSNANCESGLTTLATDIRISFGGGESKSTLASAAQIECCRTTRRNHFDSMHSLSMTTTGVDQQPGVWAVGYSLAPCVSAITGRTNGVSAAKRLLLAMPGRQPDAGQGPPRGR